MAPSSRPLPHAFLLGCATAAHQVEGGTENDWTVWARDNPARIADRSDAVIALDHYRRFRHDLAQLGAMHHNAHRFSIEWSRVEPHPGSFDGKQLRHYADVVRACRDAGMEPVVTLHHFTLPKWLARNGGVISADAPRLFARYAAACAEHLGRDVHWWITINEPNVFAVTGWLWGIWPPGERSLQRCMHAMRAVARMHAAAARAIRTIARAHGWTAHVSIAHAERPQRVRRGGSLLDQAAALMPNWLFNRWFLHACATGRLLPPVGRGERVPGLRDSLDYIGVNYYTSDVVRFDPAAATMLFARREADPALPQSSYGWTIDPGEMRRALRALWQEFSLPLLVTENGVADGDDSLRPAFIVDHLNAVLDALADGADVRGYLHWTSWDNFEWAEGYTQRFGLFAVNHETQERIPKPSAAVFAEIARTRRVPTTAAR